MAAPRPFPKYPPKPMMPSGRARIRIRGKTYYLGKHGSPESHREYERLRAEHALGKFDSPAPAHQVGETVDVLIAAFLLADPRGLSDREVQRIAVACQPLSRLFGLTRANEFRANRLRTVQDAMVSQAWMTPEERDKRGPWSRKYINKNIERLLRVFKWGESTERLPMGTYQHLLTVPALKIQDRRVHDAAPREPVDWMAQVEPCLKHMAPVVKAMVTVQYHGGLRPEEVCFMRRNEVDTSGDVWLYTPEKHKGKWRGHDLVKALGPACQRALGSWLIAAEPGGFVFQPAKRRNGADRYTESGYFQAVRRAVKKAGVKHWFVYQLRHAAGHAAEQAMGLAGAAAFLGHHSLETTKIYTDKQRIALAIETARRIG